jgi:hypothetical protein
MMDIKEAFKIFVTIAIRGLDVTVKKDIDAFEKVSRYLLDNNLLPPPPAKQTKEEVFGEFAEYLKEEAEKKNKTEAEVFKECVDSIFSEDKGECDEP